MCGGPHPEDVGGFSSTDDEMPSFSTITDSEEKEEFKKYKNSIQFYCDTLWQMCGQQDGRLHNLDTAR